MTGEREHREKRLIGLSVVLDGRLAMPAMAGVAGIVARLGLDGIWWRQPPLAGPPPSAADAAAVLSAFAGGAGQTRAGLILDLTLPEVATAAATGWTDPWLAAAATQGARLVLTGPPERIGACLRGLPVGRLPQVAVDFRAGKHAEAVLVPVSAGRDLDAEIPAAVAAAGGGPVLVELPVSIGRTAAEAHARAAAEALFEVTGQPSEQGLFGTLEQCQYRAAALAHAGVTELVCHPPGSRDLPDVLAQLRAVAAVGSHVLRPGEPPSPAPPPPAGWGGRRVTNADPE